MSNEDLTDALNHWTERIFDSPIGKHVVGVGLAKDIDAKPKTTYHQTPFGKAMRVDWNIEPPVSMLRVVNGILHDEIPKLQVMMAGPPQETLAEKIGKLPADQLNRLILEVVAEVIRLRPSLATLADLDLGQVSLAFPVPQQA